MPIQVSQIKLNLLYVLLLEKNKINNEVYSWLKEVKISIFITSVSFQDHFFFFFTIKTTQWEKGQKVSTVPLTKGLLTIQKMCANLQMRLFVQDEVLPLREREDFES